MSSPEPTETKPKKFKRKHDVIEKKKKKIVDTGDLFDEFVETVRGAKEDEDLYVPSSVEDSLLEVNSWITMPKPIQGLIDNKGIPCGLISMAYGPPDSGKTTFALTALKSAQQDGGLAILFKTEEKFSLKRAAAMGVDVTKLAIFRPKTIEEAGDKIDTVVNFLIAKKKTDRNVCIVWDSLAATPCENEIKEGRREFSMDAAKAIRGMLRRSQHLIRDTGVSILIINQVYDNTNSFGEKTTPYGGKGAIYHSAIILKFAKIGRIRPPGKKAGTDFCGITSKIEAIKNHLGQPFKTLEIEVDWKGFVIDRNAEFAPSGFVDEGEEEEDESIGEVPTAKKKRSSSST
jgi:RecA/RadA recombinase